MENATLFIRDLGIILLCAAIGGWVAKKLKQSPITGYLVAGVLIGTPSIAFPYVTDADRIQVISQLGLIFLMFSIGLGLKIQRLKAMGLKTVIATTLTAAWVFHFGSSAGQWLGLDPNEALFFAGMLMVSSSAIISKTLIDSGAQHLRHGQLGMGMTLLEDVVAVVMLTFLGSVASGGDTGNLLPAIFKTLGLLSAFTFLLLMLGVMVLPRLIHLFGTKGAHELETLLVSGILLYLSYAAFRAGYSLALGAFLLGIVVAETPRLASVQQTFSGFKDVFTTVFFVSIGMTLDLGALTATLPLVLWGTLACLIIRTTAAWLSWLMTGENSNVALQSAMVTLPLGEFSFIIAGVGVSTGIIGEEMAVAAVGISFLTSLLSPSLITHSASIAGVFHAIHLPAFGRWLLLYRELLRRLSQLPQNNLLWRLLKKRLLQITAEVLLVSAILTFAQPIYLMAAKQWPVIAEMDTAGKLVFWVLVHAMCLGPLLAIWRNLDAISMILVESMSAQYPDSGRFKAPFRFLFQCLSAMTLSGWLILILPYRQESPLVILAIALFAIVALAFGWRKINRWHSKWEHLLQQTVGKTEEGEDRYRKSIESWGMAVESFTLPSHFSLAGKSIAETQLRSKTGCAILSIERQGFRLETTGPHTHLFPGDLLLIAGPRDALPKARNLLSETADFSTTATEPSIQLEIMETLVVGENAAISGKALKELHWSRLHAIQILAISRQGKIQPFPPPDFCFQPQDILLLCGPAKAIRQIAESARPNPAPA
jgi:CPA2 family monovalent cation:H+ antiporter-2